MHNLDLTISDISKIEGKASCEVHVRDGVVKEVKFSIAEYKRFYTQAIRGKHIAALPQLTARICGTCSNAHLLCAAQAVEDAVKLQISEQTEKLRLLLNFALNIRDHALHLYVFVLPDVFGKDSILDFDENDSQQHKYLHDTFDVKAAGNKLAKVTGGRSVHAPFVTVGGFTKLPTTDELKSCIKELSEIRPKVIDLINLLAETSKVLDRKELDFAAILDDKYSFLSGDLIRTDSSVISGKDYGKYLDHVTVKHSQASGYKFDSNVYMVGALARINLGKKYLHKKTKKDTDKYLKLFPSRNIFLNNLAQAIEILHCIDSSVDMIDGISIKEEKPVAFQKQEGTGIGVIEAPRGALYYRLEVTKEGKVRKGQIVVPTGQNQIGIEASIKQYIEENMHRLDEKEKLELEIEEVVRAYDPCMSCASHFLKFKWKK